MAGGLGGVGCAGMGTPKPDMPGPGLTLPSQLPAPETTPAASGPLPRMSAGASEPLPRAEARVPYQRSGPEAAVSTISDTPAGGISTPHMPISKSPTSETRPVSVERLPIAATPSPKPIVVPPTPTTAPKSPSDPWTKPANPAPTAGLSNLVPSDRHAGESASGSSVEWKIKQPDNTDMLKDIPPLPDDTVPVIGDGEGGGIMIPAGSIMVPPQN